MSSTMQQHIAPIPCKPWTLNGLSDRLIVSHYEDNYGAAVRSLNAIRDRLAELDLSTAPDHDIRALKREELTAIGSVTLHELYFGSLGGDGAVLFTGTGDGTGLPKPVAAAFEQQFGSVAAWRREFVALAQALGGRPGWAVLSYGRADGRLYNQIADDESQAVIDAVPLLALDMHEHAYHQDFGANATAYIEAFMRNVDWTAVANRLLQATDRVAPPRGLTSSEVVPSISVEELAARRGHGESLQVIDARPAFHFARSWDMMAGAIYRDPDQVYEWSAELATGTPVVVYCAYGFNVGCAVATVLRQRGFDARFLRGGLSAWFGAGGARVRRPESPSTAA
jgi:Fe-Mn family superoxide dismutase